MNHVNNPQRYEQRLAALYQALRQRAADGAFAPGGAELAELLEISPVSATKRYFSELQARGLITVESFGSIRVVTIVETGERTRNAASQVPIEVFDELAARRKATWHSSYYDRPEQVAERLALREAEAARVATLIPRDRTPCPVCGVRGDIEHSHRRRA